MDSEENETELQDSSTSPVYDTIPMRAVNSSTRVKLSHLLNVPQTLTNTKHLARDYRGLAELMGFEYIDIRNFERSIDPTKEIIQAWEAKSQTSVGALVKILDDLERYDVLDEIQPLIDGNIKTWLNRETNNPSQDTNSFFQSSNPNGHYHMTQPFQPDVINPLSVQDEENITNYYHAYVCYADCDLDFVKQLSDRLETTETGLRLFIRERDLALGILQYDAYLRLIEERCQRVLVILSPEFFESPECEFQAKFAAGLGIDQRSNKIIPIVYKPCAIPSILSCLSKVDFSRASEYNFKWNWEKLIRSLGGKVVIRSPTEPSRLLYNSHSSPPTIQPNPVRILEITDNPGIETPTQSAQPVISEPSSSSANGSVNTSSKEHKKTKSSKHKWLNSIASKVSASLSSSMRAKRK